MHRCYELKKGAILYCRDCGFEVEVIKECDSDCKEEHCCEIAELKCCGVPMNVR